MIAGCHYRKIVSLWSAKPPGLTTYIVAFEIFDGALDTGIVAACLIFSFKQRLIQEEAHMPIDVVDVLNRTMPMMPDALSNYTQAIRQSGQLFERAAITTPRQPSRIPRCRTSVLKKNRGGPNRSFNGFE